MPTEAEIEPKVISAFAKKTRQTPAAIKARMISKTDTLYPGLGMGSDAIGSMTGPLTAISTAYEGGLQVPKTEIRKNKTVTLCVQLTTKRANGQT